MKTLSQYLLVITTILLPLSALAHDGLFPHPATHSELTHLALHALMALPIVGMGWLAFWGVKRFKQQRLLQRERG